MMFSDVNICEAVNILGRYKYETNATTNIWFVIKENSYLIAHIFLKKINLTAYN